MRYNGWLYKMARLRKLDMSTKSLRNVPDEFYLSHDASEIDFSSAGLYLVGIQTVLATSSCAVSSVVSCWFLPPFAVSAVRTLSITTFVGVLCMRKPLQIGRVRGVPTIFNALRPCLVMYISALTIEQLVHTCVAEDAKPHGISRHVVFHSAILCMAASGFWRALKPFSETDAPFLLSTACVAVIAMLPPPATPLSGPLCEAASFFAAGDRVLRAFLFSTLYSTHVYAAPPQRNSINDLAVCIMRSAAASIWVLGCHVALAWLPLLQAFVALWTRFGIETNYANVETKSDGTQSDVESGTATEGIQLQRDANGVLIAPYLRAPPPHGLFHLDAPHSETAHPKEANDMLTSAENTEGIPVTATQLASIVNGSASVRCCGASRMAAVSAILTKQTK